MSEESSNQLLAKKFWFIKHLTDNVRLAVETIPDHALSMDEYELEDKFTRKKEHFYLRKKFHKMLDELRGTDDLLSVSELVRDTTSKAWFYNVLLPNPYALAWLIIPVSEPDRFLEEAYTFAIQRLRKDILTLPANEKTAPIIMKALEFLAIRHLGPVVQKIEQKSLNMNFNKDVTQSASGAVDPEELMRRLTEVKSKLVEQKTVTLQLEEPAQADQDILSVAIRREAEEA